MRPKQFPKEDDVSASSLRNSLGGCCWSSPRVRAWDIDVKIVSAAPTAFQKRSQMWDWSHFSPSQIPWVVEPHQDALHAPQNGRLCAMSYRIYIKTVPKNVWWNWRKLKHCTFCKGLYGSNRRFGFSVHNWVYGKKSALHLLWNCSACYSDLRQITTWCVVLSLYDYTVGQNPLKTSKDFFPRIFLLLMIGLKKLFNVMKWRIMKWVCLVCRAQRLVIAIWKWKLPSLLSCQDPMCSHWFGRGVFCRTFIFFPQFKMAFLFYPFSP